MNLLCTTAFALLPGLAEGLERYAELKDDSFLQKTAGTLRKTRDIFQMQAVLTAATALGMLYADENDPLYYRSCRIITSMSAAVMGSAAMQLYKATSDFLFHTHP